MNETPALLQPLERLLNRQLEGNSDARRALNKVAGETLAIKFEGIGFDLYMHAQDDGLRLDTEYGDEPAAIISGSPLALAALSTGASDPSKVRKTGVRVFGDTAVAQGFEQLLGYLKPDWEEELSRLVGDAVAHRIGTAARNIFGWGQDVGRRMTEDFAEYFTEEGRDLPTRTEADEFFDDVDAVRSDVDRAEARLNKLQEP